jgi:hypothetical protein
VTRASLGEVFPIAAAVPMTLLPARAWTQEQWECIERGYQARGMDEKWDVFVEGHVAFLHRSWTGNGIFEATFAPVGGGWRISAAIAESDPQRVRNGSAQFNKVMLELVLSSVVLGEPATGLRAEFARLCSPQDRPTSSGAVIEHGVSPRSANHRDVGKSAAE